MKCSMYTWLYPHAFYWQPSYAICPQNFALLSFHYLGMTVGFTQVTNTAIESARYVEVCVDVLIPGEALRNFTVILIPEEGN